MRQLVLTLALIIVSPVVTLTAQEGHAQGERCGTSKGKVINNEVKGQLSIQTEKGAFTYWVRWIGGMPKDGGGPDKEMIAKIRELTQGDYVEVAWENTDEHVRVVGLKFLAHADGSRERPKGERERDQPACEPEGCKPNESAAYLDGPGPSERCGFVRGTVTAVDPKGRFAIKTEKGEEILVPKWCGGMPNEGGGFDQEMIAKIAQLKTGQHVDVNWEWNERKRCVGLKVAGN